MPVIWRTLYTLDNLNLSHGLSIGIPELAHSYNLRTHGRSRFVFQIKSGADPFVPKATQNNPNWKGRFFFVKRSSIPYGDKISSEWIPKTFKFEEVVPVRKDSSKRIQALLKIPYFERAFKVEPVKSEVSVNTSPTASMSSGASGKIVMSDINSLLDAPLPKKGKKPVAESSSKPPTGNLQIANTRKRKAHDAIDVELLETHDPDELGSLMHSGVDKVINALRDFKKKMEIAEATNEELKSQSASLADKMLKDSQDLKAMKKEVKILKGAAAKHQRDLEETKKGALASAAALVLEGKIKLIKEIRAPGFDLSSIDLEAWEAKLAFLKGEDVEAADDEAEKVDPEKEGESGVPEATAGEKEVLPGDDSNIAKA